MWVSVTQLFMWGLSYLFMWGLSYSPVYVDFLLLTCGYGSQIVSVTLLSERSQCFSVIQVFCYTPVYVGVPVTLLLLICLCVVTVTQWFMWGLSYSSIYVGSLLFTSLCGFSDTYLWAMVSHMFRFLAV